MIPLDLDGYAVNPATGTVHTRYAGEHAGLHYRTRTVKGVETLLNGRKLNVCSVCYPSPQYDPPPRPPQQRRSGKPTRKQQDEAMGRYLARDYKVPR